MFKKKMLLVAGLFLVGLMGTITASADSFIVDGDFSDWASVKKTDVDSLFDKQVAFHVVDDTLFMYVKENARNAWEKYYTNANPVLVNKDGKETALVITEGAGSGANTNLVVRTQNGYKEVEGAAGVRSFENDSYAYELAIPLSSIGEVDQVKMKVDYNKQSTFSVESTISDEPAEDGPSQPAVDVPSVEEKDSKFGITIDGDFADWADLPHIFVTNWNMPDKDRNASNCRSLGMVADGEYIYFHVKMIGGWNDPLNGNEYTVTVAGYKVSLYLFLPDGHSLPDYSLAPGTYDLNVFYKNKTGTLEDQKLIDGAAAKYLNPENGPDEVEVRVPMSIFREVYGVDFDEVKEVLLENPNLFDRGISSAETPTFPIMGIALGVICIGIGTAVVVVGKKSKKKAE